jgi:hypothetical protein
VRFAPGREVLYRNIDGPRLASVRPCRVVSDDDRGLLLWLARGSAVVIQVAADGRGIRDMPFDEWTGLPTQLVVETWQGPGVLKFIRDDRGAFTGWYVNLEERAVRWDDGPVAGVDVIDQDLDVVVAPDRSWQWKDEDEFTERLAFPDHYWVHDEAAVRSEGLRVIKMIEAGEFPFDGTWTSFQPDPSWSVPDSLPSGWDRPAAPRL